MTCMAAGMLASDWATEKLVHAAQHGDADAYSILIARHRTLVYAYAYAQLRDREEAEDVAQETFVRAYQSLGRLRAAGGWQPWLMRISRNLCHDALRRKRVRRSDPADLLPMPAEPSPESGFLSAERRRELERAVEGLPEKYRTPLLMRFASGCSRRDIAAALGVPETTVMGRLAMALRLLRERLGEER